MSIAKRGKVCKEKYYNELFETHSKDLFNFLYYIYGPDNSPKDIVQEAFIKLWNNCHKVIFEKARAFLFTVANRHMLSELAKKKTASKYVESKPHVPIQETPVFILEEKEYGMRLEKALNELTEDQRVTFLLNRIEGKKHQEIADMLGISRKAVEKRIYTALSKLRENLENF